ncbi:MAG: glucose-1-phosphate cytidylyltransferase [Nitrospinota bacterium]|nr:glucose-1-phosphate cytidylyltransferase [Nitrospinota bacterium]
MKVIILCGGLGTRLSEETQIKPKPMVEIGGDPILRHVMKIYDKYGFNEFVLALGYKGEYIKDYFLDYHPLTSDVTVHLSSGKVDYANPTAEDWHVKMIDTGKDSMTGGRLNRLKNVLKNENTFMMTYGDGVSDVNIKSLLDFHKKHGQIATVTAVRPPARFGGMVFEGDKVVDFKEKPQTGEGWINGGFFVFEKKIFDYLHGDSTVLEKEPLENLAKDGELMAYKHEGFWQCMDTVRDRNFLESLLERNEAPWTK